MCIQPYPNVHPATCACAAALMQMCIMETVCLKRIDTLAATGCDLSTYFRQEASHIHTQHIHTSPIGAHFSIEGRGAVASNAFCFPMGGGWEIKCIAFASGSWGGNQMHSASRWEVGGKSNVLHFPRGGEDKCIAENGAQEAQNEPTNGSTSMGPSCASVGACQNSANGSPLGHI